VPVRLGTSQWGYKCCHVQVSVHSIDTSADRFPNNVGQRFPYPDRGNAFGQLVRLRARGERVHRRNRYVQRARSAEVGLLPRGDLGCGSESMA
jgi:hypothetical protein